MAAIIAVTMAAFVVPAAHADDDPKANPKAAKRAVDSQVQQLGDDLDEQNAEVKAASAALDDAQAKLPPAQAALATARTTLAGAEDAEHQADLDLAATESYADQALIEYLAAQGRIKAHQEALGEIARQAFMGGDLSRLSVAMNAQSPEEFTSALAYVGTVNRSEKQILADLDDLQADLQAKRDSLDEAHARIEDEQQAAAAAVETAGNARDAASAAQTAVQGLISQRDAALQKAEELKDEIEKRLAEMKAESDRLAEIIRKRAEAARRAAERAGHTIVEGTGLLSRPVNGPITSPYGMRYHPILHVYKLHTGTDFGVPTGTAIRAARDGTVIDSYYNTAYGNRVVVDHGYVNGVYLVTTYNHMSRSTVHKGEKLQRGEVLGYSGSTGYATGPHLHFEVMEDGHFVDPMKWLS
jgi:murein DD-endopeptidase MepM/ murein hydrolase activator NlpD